MGVGWFKFAKGWDDKVKRIKTMSEDGFFNSKFTGRTPNYGAAGQRRRICTLCVIVEIHREGTPKHRNDNCSSKPNFDLRGSR